MKTKLFVAGAIICVIAAVAYAQTGLTGKWVTDPPAAAAAGGRGGNAETRLDLKIDGAKVTGTMFEGGADLEVKEGTVAGKQAKWFTIRPLNGADFRVNWTADLTDDNTISLTREFPNGVPGRGAAGVGGGGGGRGGPGGGGGAPGGAPAAGGPPAGGAPAAAAGGPPAGGAPGGGAPGGGGGGRGGPGGGGGGGGRGGGAIAAVLLHRAK
jgi:hypothetical protein